MKISQFCKETGFTIYAARYYIDMDLIHPLIINTKFSFNGDNLKEADDIIFLQTCGFKCEEMRKMVFERKINNCDSVKQTSTFLKHCPHKIDELKNKIKEYRLALKKLEELEFNSECLSKDANYYFDKETLDLFGRNNNRCTIVKKSASLRAKKATIKIDDCCYDISNHLISDNSLQFDDQPKLDFEEYYQSLNNQTSNELQKLIVYLRSLLMTEKTDNILINHADEVGYIKSIIDPNNHNKFFLCGTNELKKIAKKFNEENIFLLPLSKNIIPLQDQSIDIVLDNFDVNLISSLGTPNNYDEYWRLLKNNGSFYSVLVIEQKKEALFLDKIASLIKPFKNGKIIFSTNYFIRNKNDFTFMNSVGKIKLIVVKCTKKL
ncbi:MAG: hypothetical protein WCS62_04810 [Bacilli bacterium]